MMSPGKEMPTHPAPVPEPSTFRPFLLFDTFSSLTTRANSVLHPQIAVQSKLLFAPD